MPTLLSLPRELRDEILDYVLRSHRVTPLPRPLDSKLPSQNPSSNMHLDPQRVITAPEGYSAGHKKPAHNAVGLLLTCHQLRKETLQRIKALPCKSYILDVMVVGTTIKQLTWLYIPPHGLEKNGLINSLDIQLRFFHISADNRFQEERWDRFMNRLWLVVFIFLYDGPHLTYKIDVPYIRESVYGRYGVKKLRFLISDEGKVKMGPCGESVSPGPAYMNFVNKVDKDYPSFRIDQVEVHDDGIMKSFDYLPNMRHFWGSLEHFNRIYFWRKRFGMEVMSWKTVCGW